MPQTAMNPLGRRRRRIPQHNSSSQVNGLVDGHALGAGLVNGAVDYKDCPVAVSGASDSSPVGTVNGTKPCSTVNGAMPALIKRKSAVPSKTLRKQGGTIPGGTDASVNGSTSPDTVGLPNSSDQVAPAKNWRQRNNFRRKKSFYRGKSLSPALPPMAPLLPPLQEEDWEDEIQEVTVADWGQMTFGIQPYGPEDVLAFAFRDLALKRTDTAIPPLTANYSPAVHHPRPVKWSCYSIPTEADQFTDAE